METVKTNDNTKPIINFDYIKALELLDINHLNKTILTLRGGNTDHLKNQSKLFLVQIKNTNLLSQVYLDTEKRRFYVNSFYKIENGEILNKKKKDRRIFSSDEDLYENSYSDIDNYGGTLEKKKKTKKKSKKETDKKIQDKTKKKKPKIKK